MTTPALRVVTGGQQPILKINTTERHSGIPGETQTQAKSEHNSPTDDQKLRKTKITTKIQVNNKNEYNGEIACGKADKMI